MKNTTANWVLWLVFIAMTTGSGDATQPNIVFIMVDDMGWNDVSFHGSNQILTPNIDALAYQSVILQQYYSEAVCTPARTALLTGKYPMRLGMQGVPLFDSEDRGIPLTEKLLPSHLKELGYATHLVGKWHVGMSRPEYLPTSRGYDSHYGMRGGLIDYYTYNNVETWPNGQEVYGLDFFDNDIPQEEEERYIVDALTDRAVKIIHHHNASQPLFLHLTHNAPHAGNSSGKLQPPRHSNYKSSRHIAHPDRRAYAEIVEYLDRSIGKVVRALADSSMLNNTIIIFVSDNGAPTLGSMSTWGVNLPLRGIKFTPWEGGIRVPAFVWHSSFKPRVWNGLMHITDWLPTLIVAAGGHLSDKIDGINQWGPIINDAKSARQDALLTFVETDANRYASYRAGDYKIVVGNLTRLNNGYYGQKFMINKYDPPEYFSTLNSCEVAKIFEETGIYLDSNEVLSLRAATAIKQEDSVKDRTPCVPSSTRGCLFNIRRDPTESHDLWDKNIKTAMMLSSRICRLWEMQKRRGPINVNLRADPANFNYIYTPWILNGSENDTTTIVMTKPTDLCCPAPGLRISCVY